MIAKIATDAAKPNGYLFIPFGREKDFLAPLAVNKIHGVGKQTWQSLQAMGITTIKDLSETPVELLEKRFGKYGTDLWQKSQGIHHGEVTPYHEAKSISTENTFEENISDVERLEAELVHMTEKVAYELRQDNKMAGCITVKIRYPDFETTSRQTSIDYTFYDDELLPQARDLFHKLWRKGTPVRLLGVRLSELTGEAVQTNLFTNVERKTELYKAIDDVKNRFGKNAISKATGTAGNKPQRPDPHLPGRSE
jgi:DNA polymerase-4